MTSDLAFEWDEAKAASNAGKHAMTFEFATQVFLDPACIVIDASKPGDAEARFKAVGRIDGRVFIVVFTYRPGTRRLISARRGNTKEVRAYGGSFSS